MQQNMSQAGEPFTIPIWTPTKTGWPQDMVPPTLHDFYATQYEEDVLIQPRSLVAAQSSPNFNVATGKISFFSSLWDKIHHFATNFFRSFSFKSSKEYVDEDIDPEAQLPEKEEEDFDSVEKSESFDLEAQRIMPNEPSIGILEKARNRFTSLKDHAISFVQGRPPSFQPTQQAVVKYSEENQCLFLHIPRTKITEEQVVDEQFLRERWEKSNQKEKIPDFDDLLQNTRHRAYEDFLRERQLAEDILLFPLQDLIRDNVVQKFERDDEIVLRFDQSVLNSLALGRRIQNFINENLSLAFENPHDVTSAYTGMQQAGLFPKATRSNPQLDFIMRNFGRNIDASLCAWRNNIRDVLQSAKRGTINARTGISEIMDKTLVLTNNLQNYATTTAFFLRGLANNSLTTVRRTAGRTTTALTAMARQYLGSIQQAAHNIRNAAFDAANYGIGLIGDVQESVRKNAKLCYDVARNTFHGIYDALFLQLPGELVNFANDVVARTRAIAQANEPSIQEAAKSVLRALCVIPSEVENRPEILIALMEEFPQIDRTLGEFRITREQIQNSYLIQNLIYNLPNDDDAILVKITDDKIYFSKLQNLEVVVDPTNNNLSMETPIPLPISLSDAVKLKFHLTDDDLTRCTFALQGEAIADINHHEPIGNIEDYNALTMTPAEDVDWRALCDRETETLITKSTYFSQAMSLQTLLSSLPISQNWGNPEEMAEKINRVVKRTQENGGKLLEAFKAEFPPTTFLQKIVYLFCYLFIICAMPKQLFTNFITHGLNLIRRNLGDQSLRSQEAILAPVLTEMEAFFEKYQHDLLDFPVNGMEGETLHQYMERSVPTDNNPDIQKLYADFSTAILDTFIPEVSFKTALMDNLSLSFWHPKTFFGKCFKFGIGLSLALIDFVLSLLIFIPLQISIRTLERFIGRKILKKQMPTILENFRQVLTEPQYAHNLNALALPLLKELNVDLEKAIAENAPQAPEDENLAYQHRASLTHLTGICQTLPDICELMAHHGATKHEVQDLIEHGPAPDGFIEQGSRWLANNNSREDPVNKLIRRAVRENLPKVTVESVKHLPGETDKLLYSTLFNTNRVLLAPLADRPKQFSQDDLVDVERHNTAVDLDRTVDKAVANGVRRAVNIPGISWAFPNLAPQVAAHRIKRDLLKGTIALSTYNPFYRGMIHSAMQATVKAHNDGRLKSFATQLKPNMNRFNQAVSFAIQA